MRCVRAARNKAAKCVGRRFKAINDAKRMVGPPGREPGARSNYRSKMSASAIPGCQRKSTTCNLLGLAAALRQPLSKMADWIARTPPVLLVPPFLSPEEPPQPRFGAEHHPGTLPKSIVSSPKTLKTLTNNITRKVGVQASLPIEHR